MVKMLVLRTLDLYTPLVDATEILPNKGHDFACGVRSLACLGVDEAASTFRNCKRVLNRNLLHAW
jgi:hypothetical protein